MRILGINVSHDRSAVIIQDGIILSYIAEERLDRDKHSFGDDIPIRSIEYVLNAAKFDAQKIDIVAISGATMTLEQLQSNTIQQLTQYFPHAEIDYVGHHLSHAAAAFYMSPYNEAAIWVADGGGDLNSLGEQEAESYYIGTATQIQVVYSRYQPKLQTSVTDDPFEYNVNDKNKKLSMGRKYEQITYMLGYKFGQAGKIMGLSAYGKDQKRWRPYPVKVDKFEPHITVGQLVEEIGYPDLPISFSERADIACEIQQFVQECALLCLQHLYELTGQHNLCIAGGVGLNCVLNTEIVNKSPFSSVFIFPAAGDDGQAIGNALTAYYRRGGHNKSYFHTASLGRKYSEQEVLDTIHSSNIPFSYHENIYLRVAEIISRGAIVGWFQGGSECGPRSLGFRSILADARNPEIKDILNKKVKHREPFRPFAPAVLVEYAEAYFNLPPSPSIEFMLLSAEVLESKRSVIPGVVHVDGTSRVQVVKANTNPYLYQLLEEFYRLTNVPVLLNTSFNIAGEPIVETPEDAIRCFLSTNIDYLIIGNYLIEKRGENNL